MDMEIDLFRCALVYELFLGLGPHFTVGLDFGNHFPLAQEPSYFQKGFLA
jgi:hypothetical protein